MFSKLLLGFILTFAFTSPVYAEDAVVVVEDIPAVEEAYVPPAEASEGVGGWAVVDSEGFVHGVVVCTVDVCGPSGSWAGVLPGDYMGCKNCNLRFQTKATSDGNVAGYSGHYYEQDSDGKTVTKNNGSVKWNASDNTFDLKSSETTQNGTTTIKKKLVPSKAVSDGERIDTGFINIETDFKSSAVNDMSVKIKMLQESVDSPKAISVEYENWVKLNYESEDSLKNNIDNDVESALTADGYIVAAGAIDDGVKESSPFVETVKSLTVKVKNFFGMIFRP